MEIEVEPNINFNTNDEVVKEKSNILQQVEIQQLYKAQWLGGPRKIDPYFWVFCVQSKVLGEYRYLYEL